jgi:hypothetical protein
MFSSSRRPKIQVVELEMYTILFAPLGQNYNPNAFFSKAFTLPALRQAQDGTPFIMYSDVSVEVFEL